MKDLKLALISFLGFLLICFVGFVIHETMGWYWMEIIGAVAAYLVIYLSSRYDKKRIQKGARIYSISELSRLLNSNEILNQIKIDTNYFHSGKKEYSEELLDLLYVGPLPFAKEEVSEILDIKTDTNEFYSGLKEYREQNRKLLDAYPRILAKEKLCEILNRVKLDTQCFLSGKKEHREELLDLLYFRPQHFAKKEVYEVFQKYIKKHYEILTEIDHSNLINSLFDEALIKLYTDKIEKEKRFISSIKEVLSKLNLHELDSASTSKKALDDTVALIDTGWIKTPRRIG